ncbi:unnamed protein product, partial [Amoebophrya sp. A25]
STTCRTSTSSIKRRTSPREKEDYKTTVLQQNLTIVTKYLGDYLLLQNVERTPGNSCGSTPWSHTRMARMNTSAT